MRNRIALGVVLFLLAGCGTAKLDPTNPTIATTFYPLYDLTRSIAGNSSEVFSIVPINAEPHDYQLTPKDILRVDSAKAYVVMGVEFANFEDQLIEASGKNVIIINAAKGIQQLDSAEGKDPHVWLSPRNAIIMAENIEEGLTSADPVHSENYRENVRSLTRALTKLDEKYSVLRTCKKDTILVAHDAFSYLARDYGFNTIFISGLSPEAEPTPQQIKQLIDVAREKNLKYVFYEELIDPKVSNTIAEQVGAKTLMAYPAESTSNPEETYITIMEKNLENLKIALECS